MVPTRSRVVSVAALARATRGAGCSPKKSGTKWSRIRKVEKPRSSTRRTWPAQAAADWTSSWMTPNRNGRGLAMARRFALASGPRDEDDPHALGCPPQRLVRDLGQEARVDEISRPETHGNGPGLTAVLGHGRRDDRAQSRVHGVSHVHLDGDPPHAAPVDPVQD